MAITRAQQAKQMLQDGGMLVKPGFGGTRQGYRGDDAYGGGRDPSSPAGSTGTGGSGPTGPQELGISTRGPTGPVDKSTDEQNRRQRIRNIERFINRPVLGLTGEGRFNITDLFGGPPRGFNPPTRGDEGGQMPLWMQLGYNSEEEYNRAMGRGIMNPGAMQSQGLDLNRIAYRFMADGGFLEDTDEARQAYGLGSIVRKITRPIKKVVKKATRAVKKVAKSPTGRLLLAVAAPYALGPAMANAGFLQGLSAAQKAALISGATTGITQLASGEGLDLKDIAVSAALAGGTAKMFPGNIPGKAPPPGATDSNVLTDALGGEYLAGGNLPAPERIGALAGQGDTGTVIARNIFESPEKTGILKSLTDSVRNIGDSKILQFAKDNPFLTIVGASGLAGLMTKKEEQEEPGETDRGPGIDIAAIRRRPFDTFAPRFGGSQFDFYDTAMAAEGGRIGYQKGSKEPVAKKVMPLLDMGGMEKDYREEGGFVPIGRMEKADDVPARLSKNEFVFTADAVRNAGDGDVDKGAEVMYNMMKNLEAGGDVSEESQGLQGARRMFQTSQRLEEVL